MQRVPRRCCLSLAKQQSSLSDHLCFRHSSKVGSKTKLLNQRLGSTPGFQARAVKGPLCLLRSFTGTAENRSETAFSGLPLSARSPLLLWRSPLERLQPPGLCWHEGARRCAPPASRAPGCQIFPSRSQLALTQHRPPPACRSSLSYTSFDVWKNKIPVRRRN